MVIHVSVHVCQPLQWGMRKLFLKTIPIRLRHSDLHRTGKGELAVSAFNEGLSR